MQKRLHVFSLIHSAKHLSYLSLIEEAIRLPDSIRQMKSVIRKEGINSEQCVKLGDFGDQF